MGGDPFGDAERWDSLGSSILDLDCDGGFGHSDVQVTSDGSVSTWPL